MILSRLFMALSCATLAIGNGSILLDSSPLAVRADSSSEVSTSDESLDPSTFGGIFTFADETAPTPTSFYNVGPVDLANANDMYIDYGESYYIYSATFLAGELVKYRIAFYANGNEPIGYSPAFGVSLDNSTGGYLRIYGGFYLSENSDYTFVDYSVQQLGYDFMLYTYMRCTAGGDCYFSYANVSAFLQGWFNNSSYLYNQAYEYGLNEIRQSDYDEIYNEGYRDGYAVGMATPDEGTTGIIDLFGAIANVPINVLNGLGGLAVWHTPIVGIIVSFLLIGVICVVIKRFMA